MVASQYSETIYGQIQELFSPLFTATHSRALLGYLKPKLTRFTQRFIQQVQELSLHPDSPQSQPYEALSLPLQKF